jgi:hypothetical protein
MVASLMAAVVVRKVGQVGTAAHRYVPTDGRPAGPAAAAAGDRLFGMDKIVAGGKDSRYLPNSWREIDRTRVYSRKQDCLREWTRNSASY